MSLTAVMPVDPVVDAPLEVKDFEEELVDEAELGKVQIAAGPEEEPNDVPRIHLTSPSDEENDLSLIAARHGPGGVLAVMRKYKDYSWMTVLALRAVQLCLSPRRVSVNIQPALKDCNPVEFAVQMMELEMIDEIFQFMKYFSHVREVQHHGLAIMELLIMDDADWRDEVARRGGALLLVEIASKRKESQSIMNQVMTCMAYLAAEDYIEVMLCQHDALTYVTYVLQEYTDNPELVTRASLALLNMTVCEHHIEELMDKGAFPLIMEVLHRYSSDLHLVIIVMGVLANFSAIEDARRMLVKEGVLRHVASAMHLDTTSAVLQVACLKAVANYSLNPEHYMMMEALGIPAMVGQAMVSHAQDPGVQKYGNYFMGSYTTCPIQ